MLIETSLRDSNNIVYDIDVGKDPEDQVTLNTTTEILGLDGLINMKFGEEFTFIASVNSQVFRNIGMKGSAAPTSNLETENFAVKGNLDSKDLTKVTEAVKFKFDVWVSTIGYFLDAIDQSQKQAE